MIPAQLLAVAVALGCFAAAGLVWDLRRLQKRIAHIESNERFARECLRASHEAHGETFEELVEERAVVRQLLEERRELLLERAALRPEIN